MNKPIHITYESLIDYCDSVATEVRLLFDIATERMKKSFKEAVHFKDISEFKVFKGIDVKRKKEILFFCTEDKNTYILKGICLFDDYEDWMDNGRIQEWLNTELTEE